MVARSRTGSRIVSQLDLLRAEEGVTDKEKGSAVFVLVSQGRLTLPQHLLESGEVAATHHVENGGVVGNDVVHAEPRYGAGVRALTAMGSVEDGLEALAFGGRLSAKPGDVADSYHGLVDKAVHLYFQVRGHRCLGRTVHVPAPRFDGDDGDGAEADVE